MPPSPDQVCDADQFVDAVRRVAAGGTAMDAQVIQQLLSRRSTERPSGNLTPPGREVLELMAQGRGQVERGDRIRTGRDATGDRQDTSNIFAKLGLAVSDDDNRRVLAVLAYLDRG